MPEFDVSGLDPSQPAPPMMVAVRRTADMVGHGRTLPLIGQRRNYMLDVLCNDGRDRIYADSPDAAMSLLIPGYDREWETYQNAEAAGDRDAAAAAFNAMFMLRSEYTATIRTSLQQQANAAARQSGSWGRLTEEEREQCELGAAGGLPVGVQIEEPFLTPDGEMVTIDRGVWETPHVRLVIDVGDYGVFHPDWIPEPTSEQSIANEAGEMEIWVTDTPANMIILDCTTAENLLASLNRAGVVTLDVYPPDAEDSFYIDAVRTGRELIEALGEDVGSYVGFDRANAADATPADQQHRHDHHHHDHGDHGHHHHDHGHHDHEHGHGDHDHEHRHGHDDEGGDQQ